MAFGHVCTRTACNRSSYGVLIAAALLLLSGSAALAGSGSLQGGYYVTITANAEGVGSGAWSIALPANTLFSDETVWSYTGAEIRTGENQLVAEIESVKLHAFADPAVDLEFSVRANTGSATTFSINSAVVTFDPWVNPFAYATAGVTLTDRNLNGASITGLFPGGKAYEARYNSNSVAWADLVSSFSAPARGSTTMDERKPALPTQSLRIYDTVNDISSQFNFTLSANDGASGTSSFVVGAVPEPATLGLLALGAATMGVIRRRR